jgi:DNA repair exonuclease SbcCD nuclease subunit
MPEYRGLLFIGDPHLASRVPGHRKDDYPRRILEKLRWCLDYAEQERLLPCLLGDLFHVPRDNATWLVGELCELLVGREIIGIYGNHDCRENALCEDDTLSVLVKARLIRIVSERAFWRGIVNGQDTIVGGTSWGEHPPSVTDVFWDGVSQQALVFWMMHHDVRLPGYEQIGTLDPHEIPGIHVVVNGHIHTRLDNVQKGRTLWVTPGNISRVARNKKEHTPAVLRADVDGPRYSLCYVEVPHEPFADVFHDEARPSDMDRDDSEFIKGLKELQTRKTATGEGLTEFLEKNLDQFQPEVAQEILRLSREVIGHA